MTNFMVRCNNYILGEKKPCILPLGHSNGCIPEKEGSMKDDKIVRMHNKYFESKGWKEVTDPSDTNQDDRVNKLLEEDIG
jgi:hypothetical protein